MTLHKAYGVWQVDSVEPYLNRDKARWGHNLLAPKKFDIEVKLKPSQEENNEEIIA